LDVATRHRDKGDDEGAVTKGPQYRTFSPHRLRIWRGEPPAFARSFGAASRELAPQALTSYRPRVTRPSSGASACLEGRERHGDRFTVIQSRFAPIQGKNRVTGSGLLWGFSLGIKILAECCVRRRYRQTRGPAPSVPPLVQAIKATSKSAAKIAWSNYLRCACNIRRKTPCTHGERPECRETNPGEQKAP
jgi:hypothetical protein